jgi:hypothetical protein
MFMKGKGVNESSGEWLVAMPTSTLISTRDLTIDIGGMPIRIRTDSPEFAHVLEDRYGEFVNADSPPAVMELEIELMKDPESGIPNSEFGVRTSEAGVGASGFGKDERPDLGVGDSESGIDNDADVRVWVEAGRWMMERGDFRAEWDPPCQRGWVRMRPNRYAIDGVLRILHSLILAREGGFLVHAASVVRNGRAFVFAGISGAGKTTIARLAPPDVTLLTDEISYIRAGVRSQEPGVRSQELEVRSEEFGVQRPGVSPKSQITNHQPQIDNRQSSIGNRQSFDAFGTPFAGELAKIGQKVRAPLAALFLLKQGPENRIESLSAAEAARELLRNVLFFAQDEELVVLVFNTICSFVKHVPVRRLVFTPDARVWELIG